MLITANAADNLFTLCGPDDQEIDEKGFGFCHVCGEAKVNARACAATCRIQRFSPTLAANELKRRGS